MLINNIGLQHERSRMTKLLNNFSFPSYSAKKVIHSSTSGANQVKILHERKVDEWIRWEFTATR